MQFAGDVPYEVANDGSIKIKASDFKAGGVLGANPKTPALTYENIAAPSEVQLATKPIENVGNQLQQAINAAQAPQGNRYGAMNYIKTPLEPTVMNAMAVNKAQAAPPPMRQPLSSDSEPPVNYNAMAGGFGGGAQPNRDQLGRWIQGAQ